MNYFLALIIVILGWGGYYEYGQMQKQNARDKAEFESTISAQMVHLQEDNSKLASDNAELVKKLAAAQAKIAALSAAPPPAPASGPATLPTPPKPSLPSNDLGSFATTDGKKFDKCHLLKVASTGITINSASGITEVDFGVLPPELQTRFGFDPKKGPVLPADQVQTLEQQRALSEQGAPAAP
jgi:hypothetical protein